MRFVVVSLMILGFVGVAWAADPVAKKVETTVTSDKALDQIDQMIAKASIDKAKPGWRSGLPKWDLAVFDAAHKYYVRMVTNKGTMLIRMRPDWAPAHVTNFLYLTRLGFYDGLSFHRVITGFMAQGGCPDGSGRGGPGYTFMGEFKPEVKHDKGGMLSMANAGAGTDGSQFFLTFKPTGWLDGKHTLFGEVVEGMDVLKKLEAAGSAQGQTSEPLKMEKLTVEVK